MSKEIGSDSVQRTCLCALILRICKDTSEQIFVTISNQLFFQIVRGRQTRYVVIYVVFCEASLEEKFPEFFALRVAICDHHPRDFQRVCQTCIYSGIAIVLEVNYCDAMLIEIVS